MKYLRFSVVVALLLVTGLAAVPASRSAAQTPVVTDDNLNQSIADAKTPADHEAIAAYYDKEAADNESKSKVHHSTHATYDAFKAMKPVGMGDHCDQLGKYFEKAAHEDKALANDHREMAKKAQSGQ